MTAIALITGASSGIGFELAHLFAQKSIDLVLVARSGDKLWALKNQLVAEYGIAVHIIAIDLALKDSADELALWCSEKGIQINYLVNNAGVGDNHPFVKADWQKLEQMIHLNILALTRLTYLMLPSMISRGTGKVMNVASVASFMPGPMMSVYYATKAFVLSLSEALSNELSGKGVTVTALCPGPTTSGFQKAGNLSTGRLESFLKFASSRQVAEYGYKAMMKGRRVAVEGLTNRLMVFAIRFTPRGLVLRMVRWIHGANG